MQFPRMDLLLPTASVLYTAEAFEEVKGLIHIEKWRKAQYCSSKEHKMAFLCPVIVTS